MIQDFDMHLHTTYSDGQYSIGDLIEKVKQSGVKFFSITDHDSIDSIYELKKHNLDNITYIKGVEISSILDEKYKMHILGYFIDENNEKLNLILSQLKEARKKRFYELVDYVEETFNLKINRMDVENVVNNVNIPGKPHLAELLVKYNYVSSVKEAFEKYLENAKTKTSNRASADLVIAAIRNAGGVAIWAHPKKVEIQYNINFQELMPRLLELGINGIEVFNSLHTYDDCVRYLNYSNANNLIKTGGSDYHGEQIKSDVKIGMLYNSGEAIKIDLSQINLIKQNQEMNVMETKNDSIKLNSMSEAELEGVREFIKVQLDEMVLPYIYENKLMLLDKNNKIYQDYLKLNVDVDKLLEIYNEESLSEEQKRSKINDLLVNLYTETKELVVSVSKKKTLITSNEYNKIK